jgi:2-hydroxy-6-oxonona-2,4-dienedioate hydrolase
MSSAHWHSKDNYRSIWMYLYDVPHEIAYVDAGGIRTRYLTAGDKGAPPLILLHGTASSFETFCANIEAHAKHFRVYAVDMIGNGFTDKPDHLNFAPVYVQHVKDFMAAMGIARASFLGVSLGSFVAAKLALDTPTLVDKIVMASPFGRTLPEPTGEPTKLDEMRAARMTSKHC